MKNKSGIISSETEKGVSVNYFYWNSFNFGSLLDHVDDPMQYLIVSNQ